MMVVRFVLEAQSSPSSAVHTCLTCLTYLHVGSHLGTKPVHGGRGQGGVCLYDNSLAGTYHFLPTLPTASTYLMYAQHAYSLCPNGSSRWPHLRQIAALT